MKSCGIPARVARALSVLVLFAGTVVPTAALPPDGGVAGSGEDDRPVGSLPIVGLPGASPFLPPADPTKPGLSVDFVIPFDDCGLVLTGPGGGTVGPTIPAPPGAPAARLVLPGGTADGVSRVALVGPGGFSAVLWAR